MQKLHGIQQELNVWGHYISDTEFANTLLMSLPDSWLVFITAVNASGIGPLADVLIARVLLLYFIFLFDMKILNIAPYMLRRGMYACVRRWAIYVRPRGV